jgi:hypothetical protein
MIRTGENRTAVAAQHVYMAAVAFVLIEDGFASLRISFSKRRGLNSGGTQQKQGGE